MREMKVTMTAPIERSGSLLPEPLLTPEQTAKLLSASVSWLAKARLRGDGPRYVKIGRSVRYPRSYVLEYLRLRTRSSTSEP
jgi:predicted DNA-binding transcriptional regulator AlpA